MGNKRTYPTSTQYFPHLIEDDAVYIDKTHFIVPLIAKKSNSQYFLSRPRRFGKSMFLSTLEQVFLGRKQLFKGLYIYDKIDWSKKYPVIRLSMDKIGFYDIGLENALHETVSGLAIQYEVTLRKTSLGGRFEELLTQIYLKHQQEVVLLIDEYDKPIITYLENNHVEIAEKNRDILKSFFGVLKDSGDTVRFLFITGVSRFSKISIFSDLNNLIDLTLNDNYAAICGFTEEEIRSQCLEGLERLAIKENMIFENLMQKIKFWYDGFSWNAKDFLYNPFSTMKLLENQCFTNYWFNSGTPTFLVRLINEMGNFDFSNIEVECNVYNWHDLKKTDYVAMMLQTGYLTFKQHVKDFIYKIDFPNREVEQSFSKMLLDNRLRLSEGQSALTVLHIEAAFIKNDIPKVMMIISNLFKALPSEFFKEGKAVGESFYHSVIFLIFKILGVTMQAEVSAQQGRIDAVVQTATHIYIFEFKKNRKASAALQQIHDNEYMQHFALSQKQIFLIGVAFNLQKRGVSDWVIEKFENNN